MKKFDSTMDKKKKPPPTKVASSALEEIGIPGSDFLREALTNCTDPLKAIEDFQLENGILLPSLRPALPFLDLHGVRRLEFHQSVLEELKERLLTQIADLAASENPGRFKKLEELLEKSFPVIRMKLLRPIVMCILKHLPKINKKFLNQVLNEKELYEECDTEVKRQIWQENQSLFGDEASPLLAQYIKDKENILFNNSSPVAIFFSPSPKMRRQGEVVSKLTHMIGRNVKLYDMVLQFLRTLFLRTRNVHYCTLRTELLMALHDLEVQEICSVDPCHKFTWCLDACIRERNIDAKRSRELQGFLDGVKRGQEQVLGDLSMILCDPYAVNFLASSAVKTLIHIANSEGLPRDNTVLILELRMLSLGVRAWEMIDSQVFREPKLDSRLITKYLPCLMSFIVDDQIRTVCSKLGENIDLVPPPPPDTYLAFLQENSVACVLAMYYALHVTRLRDKPALCRTLPLLVNCEGDRAFEDTFLHSFVSVLIPLGDELASEDFCSVVFDEYLLVSASKEHVQRHILRLLWFLHHKLPPPRLTSLMKNLQPTSENSEAVESLYQALTDKIEAYQPSPAQQPEIMDSPLMSVPTPASL